MNRTKQAATGPLTEMLLEQFKVNKAFISVGGISLTDGITDYDLDEAYISRKCWSVRRKASFLPITPSSG